MPYFPPCPGLRRNACTQHMEIPLACCLASACWQGNPTCTISIYVKTPVRICCRAVARRPRLPCGFGGMWVPPSNRQVLPFLHTLTPCRPAGHFPRARRGSLPRLPLAGRGKSHVHHILYTTASLGIAVFASLPMSWGLSGRSCASFQGNIRGLRACHRPWT